MTEKQESKRDFLKKSVYVVPTILTLKAIPTFAGSGSGRAENGNNGVGNGLDPQPPGNPPVNDGPGSELRARGKKYKKFGRKNRA
jgi:hypothetical protein